jgi:hypothetical protein
MTNSSYNVDTAILRQLEHPDRLLTRPNDIKIVLTLDWLELQTTQRS